MRCTVAVVKVPLKIVAKNTLHQIKTFRCIFTVPLFIISLRIGFRKDRKYVAPKLKLGGDGNNAVSKSLCYCIDSSVSVTSCYSLF